MILFLALLVLIIVISGLSAYLSMRDFPTSAEDFKAENSLFLIRKPINLQFILSVHNALLKGSSIISLERLFKGKESALVIYGPKKILQKIGFSLDLLELEDYTKPKSNFSVLEIGEKVGSNFSKRESIFTNFPKLDEEEQVWCQLVLQTASSKDKHFNAQIRIVAVSRSLQRRDKIFKVLESSSHLVKIPKPYSSSQLLDFYQKRTVLGKSFIKLLDEEIIKFWSLPVLRGEA